MCKSYTSAVIRNDTTLVIRRATLFFSPSRTRNFVSYFVCVTQLVKKKKRFQTFPFPNSFGLDCFAQLGECKQESDVIASWAWCNEYMRHAYGERVSVAKKHQ